MFASLHRGRSTIGNYSGAADPQSTLACLRALGVRMENRGSMLIVEGVGREGFNEPNQDLDCGNSGTTMRLMAGILAGAGITCRLVGDQSLSSRTMRRIIDPLQQMGARIEARAGDYAPLGISRTGPLDPLHFDLPIPSAQLKSCVLLAGLFGDEPTRVVETVQSRDHTERLLQLAVEEREEDGARIISSSRDDEIPEQTYAIPGDFSAAAFWLVAGAIHPRGEITIRDTGINPTRNALLDILQEMGARLSVDNEREEGREPVADITVRSSELKPINITRSRVPNCIDELPILAIAMLFADGVSRISGAAELRHKETDRLSALAGMLEKAGAEFEEFDDGLKIHGRPDFRPEPATFESHHDHRIAMSAAVLGLMGTGTSFVSGAECTEVSYPAFWDDLAGLTN